MGDLQSTPQQTAKPGREIQKILEKSLIQRKRNQGKSLKVIRITNGAVKGYPQRHIYTRAHKENKLMEIQLIFNWVKRDKKRCPAQNAIKIQTPCYRYTTSLHWLGKKDKFMEVKSTEGY